MYRLQFDLKFIYLMKNFKEIKRNLEKYVSNLKEYHILKFLISVLDCEKRKKMVSYSILFFFKIFYFFLLFFKISKNNFYLFSKNRYLFNSLCYEFLKTIFFLFLKIENRIKNYF